MCEEVFQDITSLLEHHGAQHVFPCGHCSASYTSKLSLEKQNLETQSEVDNHKKNVHPSIENSPSVTEAPSDVDDAQECVICKPILRAKLN